MTVRKCIIRLGGYRLGGKMFDKYYEVVDTNGLIRYSTVYQDDAVFFSQELYRRTKMFSDVFEVDR